MLFSGTTRLCFLFLLFFSGAGFLPGCQAQNSSVSVLPQPALFEAKTPGFRLSSTFALQLTGAESPRLADAADRFLGRLSAATHTAYLPAPWPKSAAQAPALLISCEAAGTLTVGNDESYELDISERQIRLTAPTDLGILHGLETLLQLLQHDAHGFYFPGAAIRDAPRFAWRGLLIDAARHFIPVPVLKRNLDAMAAAKLNVLHWHLSDDQAFRVESASLPRLHQLASGGQYYTQKQVRDVLHHANMRGIRVVPEFDMPAHATAFIVAYPELASNDSVYALPDRWGILNISIDPTKESTYRLIDTFLKEMTALFPDEYFHIGGDENDGRQWKRSPRIQAYMKQKGLKDAHALHTHFNQRVEKLLAKHGKKMIGWDEILHPGLPKTTIIQSWRGQKFLVKAAQQGHPVLLSNGYYLDLNYSAASHYLPDPIPESSPLTPEERQRVLGGEAAMWTEFADSVILDSRIWPRAAAVAERLWSPAHVRDVPDMYRRLAIFSQKLETLGLTHNSYQLPMLRAMAGSTDVSALQVLTDVLEPVKEYKRHFQGMKYTPATPLNRLADAAKPESDVAREFSEEVEKILANPKHGAAFSITVEKAERQLQLWQQNHKALQGLFASAPALAEYEPLSVQLANSATAGLEAIGYMYRGRSASPEWYEAQKKVLEEASKPHGQAELAIIKAIEKLVKAVR